MRTIYEVWYKGYQDKISFWTGCETREEAEQALARRLEWSKARDYDLPHWIEEKQAEDWPIPPKLKPTERYSYKVVPLNKRDHEWHKVHVVVQEGDRFVGEYDRNYSMLRTFYPFRQLRDGVWKDYALISPTYVSFSVMDLSTGEIIASNPPPKAKDDYVNSKGEVRWRAGDERPEWGFCPVEFYVPDWREFHDDSIIPGSKYWDLEQERLTGEFGFVAGCVWGDDSSWKIQFIDLSKISEGQVKSDDRFGYIELPAGIDLADAVRYSPSSDEVEIALPQRFKMDGTRIGEE